MRFTDCVLSVLSPTPLRGSILAFVGAGGKTSALYALAGELAADGARVLVTMTTMIYDPASEGGRGLEGVDVLHEFAPDTNRESHSSIGSRERALDRIRARAAPGKVFCVASKALPSEGKLRGIDPDLLEALAPAFDYLLVEADGSRRLPVKAPGPAEPVMPPCADLVLGCVGLDCLGRPIAADTVHRHERFADLVGAQTGEAITAAHLVALATAKAGLFKAAPPSARRLVVLNKADLLSASSLDSVLGAFESSPLNGIDLIVACTFAARSDRVLALRRGTPQPGFPSVQWRL
ncbi:MAG: selenium cofactor biosynthesis protein YqeC [Spirochaetes bacterium]|nr:selenium cofactor biosynthesis protein YqeC [Spirochaetota bacterium]